MSSRGLSRLRQFKPVPVSSGADALMSLAKGWFVVDRKLSVARRSGNSMMNLRHACRLRALRECQQEVSFVESMILLAKRQSR